MCIFNFLTKHEVKLRKKTGKGREGREENKKTLKETYPKISLH